MIMKKIVVERDFLPAGYHLERRIYLGGPHGELWTPMSFSPRGPEAELLVRPVDAHDIPFDAEVLALKLPIRELELVGS